MFLLCAVVVLLLLISSVGCCTPEKCLTTVGPDPVVVGAPYAVQEFPALVPEQVSYPVVHIVTQTGARGTGSIVAQREGLIYVLSAFHVFETSEGHVEPREVRVLNPDPVALFGFAVNTFDQEADLVLLTGPDAGHRFTSVRLADRPPDLFSPVAAAGTYPGWADPILFRGHVTSLGRENALPVVTASTFPGASGGPIFIHQDGTWKQWAATIAVPMICAHGICDWQDNIHLVSPVHNFLQGALP